jgi:putative ABC transport system permease protein
VNPQTIVGGAGKTGFALPGEVSLAVRNVVRQRRRSAMAISAIAFGVVALLLAGGFIEWVYWAMRDGTIHSQLGHLQVTRPGYLYGGMSDPYAHLLPEDSRELRQIAALDQVAAVAPRLSFSGLVSHNDSTVSFLGEGVLPDREKRLSRSLQIRDGTDLSADDPRGIILGEGLAANLGVQVGDTLILVANTRSGGVSAVEGHVKGLFFTPTKAYDDAALRVPLPMAQLLMKTPGAHRWVVLLDDTNATEGTVRDLRQAFAGSNLQVVPWYDLADFYNKTKVLFGRQVGVIKIIIAVIVMLSISNTLMMGVLERTAEIGTTMALGARRSRILKLFLGEATVLGLIGAASGLLLGLALATTISAIGIPMPPPPGMARGFTGEIMVTWPLALDALLLAFGTALLAGIYPAWKASRMDIVDALRHGR